MKNDCSCLCDPTVAYSGSLCDECVLKTGTGIADCDSNGTKSVDTTNCVCNCNDGYSVGFVV